VGCVKKEVL